MGLGAVGPALGWGILTPCDALAAAGGDFAAAASSFWGPSLAQEFSMKRFMSCTCSLAWTPAGGARIAAWAIFAD